MRRYPPIWLALTVVACADHDPELSRVGGPERDPMSSVTAPPGEGSGTDESVTWCQALAVLEASCHRCHVEPPNHGAPFSLQTYDDTQAPYYDTELKRWEKMLDMVSRELMPPWTWVFDPPLDPPLEPLSCEQRTTLLAWLEQGAQPIGGTACLEVDKTLLDCAAGGAAAQ